MKVGTSVVLIFVCYNRFTFKARMRRLQEELEYSKLQTNPSSNDDINTMQQEIQREAAKNRGIGLEHAHRIILCSALLQG